jgi:tRNA A37 threonylcarbamoyltransferase TsaD
VAKSIRVEINRAGVEALLKSKEVQDDLLRRAEAIASAAGPGMEASVRVGKTRARASVRTADLEAILEEARHKALTNAIDAGRN